MSRKNKRRLAEEQRELEIAPRVSYQKTREEKLVNKRKERHIEHALRTKNIDELIEYEEDFE
jgi:hypothetical protein